MSVLQEKVMHKHKILAPFLTGQSEFRCQGRASSVARKGGRSQEQYDQTVVLQHLPGRHCSPPTHHPADVAPMDANEGRKLTPHHVSAPPNPLASATHL